jgi:uncharacterized protein
MQLHQERPDYEFVLRGAGGDSARVNDLVLHRSFIVAPDRLLEAWPVRDVASLSLADLEPALAMKPEVLVIGTGAGQGFPPPETLAACLARGVGLEAMTNAAAARTYAVLAAEGRRVVAAFILQG